MTNTRTFYHFGGIGVLKASVFKDDKDAINWAIYYETYLDKVIYAFDSENNRERISVDMLYDPRKH